VYFGELQSAFLMRLPIREQNHGLPVTLVHSLIYPGNPGLAPLTPFRAFMSTTQERVVVRGTIQSGTLVMKSTYTIN